MTADWIRMKRRLVEDYLEAQIALQEITREEAQKKYESALRRLKKLSDEEHRDEILRSL